jgi:hypothetical protein
MTRGHVMRLALTGLLGMALGCSSGEDTRGSADCSESVVWRGEHLKGAETTRLNLDLPPPVAQHRVDIAPCGENDAGTTITLSELAGVPPELALAEAGASGVNALFLAEGAFFQLPEHPLHASRYRSAQRPRLDRSAGCRAARPMRGEIVDTDEIGGYLVVGDGGLRSWRIDARTQIDAEALRGVPRVRNGQAIRVTGLRCPSRRLVARSVAAT